MNEISTDLRALGQHLWPDDSVLRPRVGMGDRPPNRRRSVLMTAMVGASTAVILAAILTAGLVVLGHSKATPAVTEPPATKSAPLGGLDMLSASDGWGWNDEPALVARTSDGGSTFTDVTPRGLTSDQTVESVTAVDTHHAWAIVMSQTQTSTSISPTVHATLYRTSDGGAAWKSAPINPYVQEVAFVDALHGWTVVPSTPPGSGDDLLRTVDGGATWSVIYSVHLAADCVFSPTFVTKTFGVATDGCGASISITRNGGVTWQQLAMPIPELGPAPTTASAGPVTFTSPTTGSVFLTVCGHGEAVCRGSFYRTTDGGSTWSATTPILSGGGVGVLAGTDVAWAPYSCLTSCVVSDEYPDDFLFTTNGGHTWSHSTLPAGMAEMGIPEDFEFVTPRVGFEVNIDGRDALAPATYTYFRTSDGGRTWTQFYPRMRG